MSPFVQWVIVFVVIGLVIAIPPKYDPAVRLKEWLERKRP